MPTSPNHTEVSIHCCHIKHTAASSQTLLSDLVQNKKRKSGFQACDSGLTAKRLKTLQTMLEERVWEGIYKGCKVKNLQKRA
jgi:hypothetical protein